MEGMILNDVMVDLETLGKRAGCVIVSVGAVKFDPKTGFVDVDNSFYKAITVESAMRYGLTVDPETLRWWMKHSKEAQAVFSARIAALGEAHSILTQSSWSGAPLRSVIEGALAPHRGKVLAGYWPMRDEADPRPAMSTLPSRS